MKRTHLVLLVSTLVACLGGPSVAQALPGDPAIDSQSPFRLDDRNLEPGCFVPGRGPVDLDTHLDLTYLMNGEIARELHVTVDHDSPVNVDQVLVPSAIDGYQVYNTFTNTGNANDIGPNFTAVDLFAPDSNGIDGPDPISTRDVIVCVSDHGAAQNEPYQQEDGGLVSAKNRPIIAPHVTAFGQSAIAPLKTYKIGFGYSVEKWYTAPSYDGANTFPFHPTVTDPNAVPSPTWLGALPSSVRIAPRPNDFAYDARRVNDVDQFGEEFGDLKTDYGQTTRFRQEGDMFAWTSSNNNEPDTLAHLITLNAQGDLPMKWSIRPSLASPSSLREVTFNDADFRAWDKSWQDYYCGKGPRPAMLLPPGTNSPDPRDCAIVVNPPVSQPAEPVVNVTTPAPVVNTTVVQPQCVSNRVINMKFGKKVRKASVRLNGVTYKAHKSNGRLRLSLSLRGLKGLPGQYVKVTVKTQKRHHKAVKSARLYKLC
jgi:hypothetical protein